MIRRANVTTHQDEYPVDGRGYCNTAAAAANYTGMSIPYLNKARHYGDGPAFVKFGKSVRYSYAALDAWAAKHARTGTREDVEAA